MPPANTRTTEADAASIDVRHTEALLETGALQSALFNSANFSSIATGAKGVIQIFNVGAERMLGYTAFVKHLVEQHGGSVQVTSPGEGQGATFSLRIPLTVVHSKTAPAERIHPKGIGGIGTDFKRSDLSGVTVLVIDDQADARDLIQRVLADCDANVITVGTAAEALRAVETERPDVLVSDIGMPDVDGYDLLRRVRALGHARGGRVPAIALTAFARSEDRTRALRAGFLVHVSKPVEPAELIATVASVVGRTGELSAQ